VEGRVVVEAGELKTISIDPLLVRHRRLAERMQRP
jgi:hypothetical protein